MERGAVDPEAEQVYEESKRGYEEARRRLGVVEERYNEILSRVEEKEEKLGEAREEAYGEYGTAMRLYQLKVLGVRLGVVLPLLAVSIFVWNVARRNRARYMIHANSFLAFSVLLFGYTVLKFVWSAVHVIGVSIFGALACGLALVYIKRGLLSFEKVAMSRVGENRCPWCGFTALGAYCLACGKKILESCPECGKPRSVLAIHCPSCGEKLRGGEKS